MAARNPLLLHTRPLSVAGLVAHAPLEGNAQNLSSPRGAVLKVNDNAVLFDEDAITQYILETTGNDFACADAQAQAASNEWLTWNRAALQPTLGTAAAPLNKLEKQLASSLFVTGDRPTVADVSIADTLAAANGPLPAPIQAWQARVAALFPTDVRATIAAAPTKASAGAAPKAAAGAGAAPKAAAAAATPKAAAAAKAPATPKAAAAATGAGAGAGAGGKGAGSKSREEPPLPSIPKHASKENFFVTTAINYTNGKPHMGHAYEAVFADSLARYYRLAGRNVYFMTGTDEHGQKIADTARDQGVTPIELCDMYSGLFQDLNAKLNVSHNFFVRTTMQKHKQVCHWLYTKSLEAGDIYLGSYEGWYNVREETFVTETEAAKTDYKDPTTGKPLQKQCEASYFFRLSKFHERLLAHINEHPEFIQPELRRNEILARLQEPLQDLSISRTTFNWGIPLPSDPAHVMYVWFDALTNYLSGVAYPSGELAHFWPANVHVVGKDITWFHSVIWPCMLMSVGIPLPRTIFAHGFVNDELGRKMSKSVGNVIDPLDVLAVCPSDTFRYYLLHETTLGSDLPMSARSLMTMHNADLADTLGNLVHRAVNLCSKFCGGVIPDVKTEAPFDVAELRRVTETSMAAFNVRGAVDAAMECVRKTNQYITDRAPWHSDDAHARQVAVRTTVEAVYIFAHFLSPYIPSACDTLFAKLHTPARLLPELRVTFDNLTPGTPVDIGSILFGKVEPLDAFPTKKVEVAETLSVAELDAAVTAQGLKVRQLKESKADAESVKAAVEQLLALKARLAKADPATAAAAAASKDKDTAKKGKGAGAGKAEAKAAPAAAAPAVSAPSAAPVPAAAAAAAAPAAGEEKKKDDKSKGKEAKAKAAAEQAAAAAASAAADAAAAAALGEAAVFAGIDIRVGTIVDAWEHPSSEKLWCEKIDVGEPEPREIGSGLRAFYKREGMVGARVLVVCNLKAIKLAGFPSNGMVLCTKGPDGSVEFLPPPADAKPGDRLVLPGAPGALASPSQVAKQKLWEKIAPILSTNAEGAASVGGHVLLVNGKPCVSKAPNSPIS